MDLSIAHEKIRASGAPISNLDLASLEELFFQCVNENHSIIQSLYRLTENKKIGAAKRVGFFSPKKQSGVTLFSIFYAFYLSTIKKENVILLTPQQTFDSFSRKFQKIPLKFLNLNDISIDWLNQEYQENFLDSQGVSRLIVDCGSIESIKKSIPIINHLEETILVLKRDDLLKKNLFKIKAALENYSIHPSGMVSHEI